MDSHLSGIWPLVGGVRFGAMAGEKCPDCAAVLEPEEFSICCMKQGTLASWLGNVTTWPSDGTERFGSSIKHPEPHARRNETRETDPPSLHTLSVRRHQPVLPAHGGFLGFQGRTLHRGLGGSFQVVLDYDGGSSEPVHCNKIFLYGADQDLGDGEIFNYALHVLRPSLGLQIITAKNSWEQASFLWSTEWLSAITVAAGEISSLDKGSHNL
ncbi:uncharacterized protein CIMG_06898 [Coccidioides immitis RS]|uniref:Uncharacterized protein n=1 Tax=Coccidioides immitis (strain RS) TaxID=246410 RepID=J3K967_COCIM|nr:uncharacterized protein CIMG_06898 [Coccidioides immitis RS]EAS31419.3 hypothetical protein CIMG_06898 [Coccidioides immitis RS]